MNKTFYKVLCIFCVISIILSMFTITSFASGADFNSNPPEPYYEIEPGIYHITPNGTGQVYFNSGELYLVHNKQLVEVSYFDLDSGDVESAVEGYAFDPSMEFILYKSVPSDSRLIFTPLDFELCNVVIRSGDEYVTRVFPHPPNQDFEVFIDTYYSRGLFSSSDGGFNIAVLYGTGYLYHSYDTYNVVDVRDSSNGTFLTFNPDDVEYYSFSVEDLYTGDVITFTYPSSITDFASFVDSSFNTNDFIVVDEYGNVMVAPNGVTMGSYPLHNSQYLDDPMTSDYEIIDGDTYYYSSVSTVAPIGYYTISPDADWSSILPNFTGHLYYVKEAVENSVYVDLFSLIYGIDNDFSYIATDVTGLPSSSYVRVMAYGDWTNDLFRYLSFEYTSATLLPSVYNFFFGSESDDVSPGLVLDGFYSFSDTPDFATLFDYPDGNYLYYSLTPATMYDRRIALTFYDRLNNEYNYLVFDRNYQENDDIPLAWDDLNGWRLSYCQHIHFDSFNTNNVNLVQWFYDSDNGSFVSDDGSSSPGYDPGYDDGYDVGYNEGYDAGYREGHYLGFNSGKVEGYDEGYDVGYNEGYDAGASSGSSPEDVYEAYTRGYETGYLEGENAGMTSSLSSNFFGNFFSGVFDSLDNFKLAEYSILGTTYYITPWSIVTTVSVVMMILWILKLIAGG